MQALVKEAAARGEQLGGLEATAARLKEFSGKQDGAAVQSQVLAARERLGRLLQQAGERGAALEEARRRAKQVRGDGDTGRGCRAGVGACGGERGLCRAHPWLRDLLVAFLYLKRP